MLNFRYEIDQDKCIGCEKCAEVCPTLAIDFDGEKKKAFALDIDQCLICHQCLEVCPVDAIRMEGGLWQEDIRIQRNPGSEKEI